MYLKRYHDVTVSPSGVWRILKRLELNRLPSSQRHKPHQTRWKRYEKPQPGHRVQVDVKFISPIGAGGKWFYQFTAIDDCTRLRVLRAYPRCNQKTAIQFLDYLLARLGRRTGGRIQPGAFPGEHQVARRHHRRRRTDRRQALRPHRWTV